MEFTRSQGQVLLSCLLGIGTCILVFVVSNTHEPYQFVRANSKVFSAQESGSEIEIPPEMCAHYSDHRRLSQLDCKAKPSGLQRLHLTFELENCDAALQSTRNAGMVREKILKLAESSVFVFFRGAAALFDFNMMCADPEYRKKSLDVPRVISNGDCHPENFGVMVQANGLLNWGVNDFDQAFNAPFTWDLKRGATGFMLACLVRNHKMKFCSNTTANFIKAYSDMFEPERQCKVANEERFIENSKATDKEDARVVKQLFNEARSMETEKETKNWLEKKGVDADKNKFFQTDEVFPLPDSDIEEFQESIIAYLYHGVPALVKYPYLPDKNGKTFWTVEAVAAKEKSGTGSIGLNRYLLLMKGRNEKYGRIILEMKAETRSVLENYFRYHVSQDQEAKRAVDAETAAWPYTNLFYGWTRYKNEPYIIREKSKHDVSADLEDMSDDELYSYAGNCGKALGLYHMRARCANVDCKTSDTSYVDVETCKNVQDYLQQYKKRRSDGQAFNREILQFAKEESKRQMEAWSLLKSWVNDKQASGENILNFLTGGL